jgi:predicted secreted protein
MGKSAAKGTTFKVGTVSVGSLTSIGGLALSADPIEVTALDSADGYREYIGGLKDGGELSLSGLFDYSDAGQKALYTAFGSGAVTSCSIVFPTALSCSWSFDGVVVGFETNSELEDAVGFDCTVKVTGKPTLT